MSNIEFQFAKVKIEKNKVCVHPLLYSSAKELCKNYAYNYDGYVMNDVEIQITKSGMRLYGKKIEYGDVFKVLSENGINFIAMSIMNDHESYSYTPIDEVITKMEELFYVYDFRMLSEGHFRKFINWRLKKIPVTFYYDKFEDETTQDWVWSKRSFPLKEQENQEITINTSNYLIVH